LKYYNKYKYAQTAQCLETCLPDLQKYYGDTSERYLTVLRVVYEGNFKSGNELKAEMYRHEYEMKAGKSIIDLENYSKKRLTRDLEIAAKYFNKKKYVEASPLLESAIPYLESLLSDTSEHYHKILLSVYKAFNNIGNLTKSEYYRKKYESLTGVKLNTMIDVDKNVFKRKLKKGNKLYENEEYDKALPLLEYALPIVKQETTENSVYYTKMIKMLYYCHINTGSFDEAERYKTLHKQLTGEDIEQERKLNKKMVEKNLEKGLKFYKAKKYAKSAPLLEMCMPIIKEMLSDTSHYYILQLFITYDAFAQIGAEDKAEYYKSEYERLTGKKIESNVKSDRANLKNDIKKGLKYYEKNKFDQAAPLLENCLQYLKEEEKDVAASLSYLKILYIVFDSYEKAGNFYKSKKYKAEYNRLIGAKKL